MEVGLQFRRRNIAAVPIRQRAGRSLIAKMDILERVLFVAFVVTTNAFVVMNMGWIFLTTTWNSVFSALAPVLSLAALASFLGFVLLEDLLRARRYGAAGL